MKRVMCLRFLNWPIQRRYAVLPPDRRPSLILHAPASRGKTHVRACCRAARQRGVIPGMALAEAQSLWPASAGKRVRFELHDPYADLQRLRELASWCQQFSPLVAIDDEKDPDCLLLDATGCDYIGGEEALAATVLAALQRRCYKAVIAIADTIGTAWAVAHHGIGKRHNPAEASISIVPSGRQADALSTLPIEALRLPIPTVQILHALNIRRIGQLLVLPRADLPSRFGPELLLAIDRALGIIPEIATLERMAEPLEASWDFEDPVADGRIIVEMIDHLLDWILARIPEYQGVQRLLCSLKLFRHEPISFSVERLRPTASKYALMELVKLRVERLRLVAEVTALNVRAGLSPLEFRQDELFGGAAWNEREVAGLLEILSNRLGEGAVLRSRLEADVQPEFAYRYEPWLTPRSLSAPRGVSTPKYVRDAKEPELPTFTRPAFLKSWPVPIAMLSVGPCEDPLLFCWNEREYSIERCWGPERIEIGWWRGEDVRRDYYVVETITGERFWIFQDLFNTSWFLHGVFA